MTRHEENALSVPSVLWTPAEELVVPAEAVTPDQFRKHFADSVWSGQGDIVTLGNSLAALRPVDKIPTAYLFLDMDDLLGPLSTTLRRVMHTEEQDAASGHVRASYHDYGEGMFFGDRCVTDENKARDTRTKQALIRLVKNEYGLIPDEDIDEMGKIVAACRRAGVFTAVISSSIEGAELSAIDFLGKHFPRNCDGIVITSGHYQLADKGQAALNVMNFAGTTPGMAAVHIDDLIFNTTKVRAALQTHPDQLAVATFQPRLASHFPYDSDSFHARTPLESLQQAHAFLEQYLGDMPIMPTVRELLRLGGVALHT